MNLHIIGSGDAFGSGGKFNTCFHVTSKSGNFLIDCGASSLLAIKRTPIELTDITTIFISHFHGDHFGGLPFFILDAQLVQKRHQPLTIVGPVGLKERTFEIMEGLYRGSSAVELRFDLRFIEAETNKSISVNDIDLIYYPVIHSPESNPHGLRISAEGKIIAYSGDTEWTEELIPMAEGADLFIVECYNAVGHLKFHMNYELLIEKSKSLAAKKIMLTHLGKDMLAKQDLEFEVCEDGQVIALD